MAQVKVIASSTTVFKPFTIQITAETKEELMSLWHRFNPGRTWLSDQVEYEDANLEPYEIWKEIDDELEKYN